MTLGQPEDGGQLDLDLEAEGVVALTGDPDTCRGVARAILTELAFTPLADTLEVIVIGDLAPAGTTDLDHMTLAACWTRSPTTRLHGLASPTTCSSRTGGPTRSSRVATIPLTTP